MGTKEKWIKRVLPQPKDFTYDEAKQLGVLKYKGYSGSIEFTPEDNCFFGKVLDLHRDIVLYEGNTIDELRKDFEEGVDSYLEGCKAEGVMPVKPYSGKLNLRMPSELHARIAAYAAGTGTTINEFINRAIRHELEHEGAF